MKGGIGQLMKQAQQMQADMKKAQEELASLTVTGESGAGLVKIVMTCRHQVQSLAIDESLLAVQARREMESLAGEALLAVA